MCSPKKWIINVVFYPFFICCFILFGCMNDSFSNIQNIGQNKNTIESWNRDYITIVTFNIRAGGGIKNPTMNPRQVVATEENLITIAATIKSVDADIVGLQEVRGFHQAKFIAKQLNMNFAYSAHGTQTWWGLAILSKYKLTKMGTKIINSGGNYGDRIALLSEIDISGKSINVLNVHYVLENYESQVRTTMRLLETIEYPIVLMGDFNRKPYTSEIETIRSRLTPTCEVAAPYRTKCKSTGYGKIDYVFVDQINFEVLDVGTVRGANGEYLDASDHLAYWSKVKLK